MKETLERLFQSDNRAVAPVLGVALLFAIAAIALSAWQTTVIPQQNKEVEFDHYGDIRQDMGDLRQAHQEVASSGEPQSPTLRLGASYRPRVFGVNPPNPQGSLETESLGTYEIKGEHVDVNATNICGGATPQTDALRYDPSYNRLSDADTPPIVYESTVRYRKEGLQKNPKTTPVLIQKSTINILPLRSDVNRSSPTTSVTLASRGYLREKELNASATPTLVVPTKLSADVWEDELLGGSVSNVSSDSDELSDVDVLDENEVGIELEKKGNPFPWTVRCAITTTGDTPPANFSEGPDTPPGPMIMNGGVGRGGITEHTPDSNTDKIVIPNGKWVDIANIESIRYANAEAVPVNTNNVEGEGVVMEYMLRDGNSDKEVSVEVEAAYDAGNDEWVGYVRFEDPSNDNDYNWLQLRESAARHILQNDSLENGPDILDDSNYVNTFQDGAKSLVDAIQIMEDATLHTSNVAGRLDMKVESGDLIHDIDDDDEFKTIKEGETSEIEFDVTATGEMEGDENVDLVIRDSDGSELDSVGDRADRQTLTDVEGEESFTLIWEPDWENIDNGEYQILVEGESDQEFGTVEVYQGGNVRLNVTIDNATSPVDYGDTVETYVTVENVGDTDADDAQVDLKMAGQDGPQPQFDLAAGENTTLRLEYDTQENLDPTNTGEKTLKATWNDESTDTEIVVVERPDIILDPQVADLTAGEDGQTQTFEFTLGEDLTKDDEISVDVSDTGDAVDYDGNDGSWTIVQGDGTELSPDLDNGKVTYKVGPDDSEGDTVRFEGSAIDASSADADIRYDVEYRVESADSYAEGENGDTESTSFETTSGQQIEVEIVDSGEPIEYGETFTATVRATNEGGAQGDSGILLSLADVGGPEETVQLGPGESTTVTMTYDTEQLDSDAIGDAELVADARNDTDSRTVTIDPPTLIKEPTVDDVPAGEGRVNQTMGFTLGEDTGGASIRIDLTNTSDDVSYNADSANWTIVEGDGSISLNANNNQVESVTYQTNSESDLEGDRIVIAADYTDTSEADTTSATEYDITYELTDANDYPTGETNSTSFETTPE
jgi:hypothetical protein